MSQKSKLQQEKVKLEEELHQAFMQIKRSPSVSVMKQSN
jgi:hypothetical protein